MAVVAATAWDPWLVVRHDDPDAVRSFVASRTRRRLEFVPRRRGAVSPVFPADSSTSARSILGDQLMATAIVEVPLDGPIGAFTVALRGLRDRASANLVVIPLPPDRSPPPTEALVAVASVGLTPGADLACVQWADEVGIWWTDDSGPVRLPITTSTAAAARRGAVLLTVARGFDPETAIGRRMDAIAIGAAKASPADWSALLAARFIDGALDRLSDTR